MSATVKPQSAPKDKSLKADPKKEEMRKTKEEAMAKTKKETSSPFFRDTKVLSCSKVLVKNGEAVAVAFPHKKSGYQAPGSYENTSKSSFRTSLSQYCFGV